MPRFGLLFASLALMACKGGKDEGGPDAPSTGEQGAPADLAEALDRLGVDLDVPTGRADGAGGTLPEDFGPLGSAATLSRIDELVMVGLDTGEGNLAIYNVTTNGKASVVLGPQKRDLDTGVPALRRAVIAGDLDGDGKDEVVLFEPDGDDTVATIIDDQAASFEQTVHTVPTTWTGVIDLQAAAGDFDGDTLDEIVLAARTDAGLEVVLIDVDDGTPGVSANIATLIPQTEHGYWADLVAAQLDYDASLELAVAFNEYGSNTGLSRAFTFDDARRDFAALALYDEPLIGLIEGKNLSARTAGVAAGDFDGDGLDELVFAGVDNPGNTSCADFVYTHLAFDDAVHDMVELGQGTRTEGYEQCSPVSPWRVTTVLTHAVDLDGDGVPEVVANDAIFANFLDGVDLTTPIERIPNDVFLDTGSTSGGRIERDRVAMATGDFNADGRQEIVVHGDGRGDNELRGWGLAGPNGVKGFGEVFTVFDPPAQTAGQYPALVAANVDSDSVTVAYSDASHVLAFTAPVVQAVLAAPPCDPDLGQGVADETCRTSFGDTSSQGSIEERGVNVSASAHAGLAAEGTFLGFSVAFEESVAAIRNVSNVFEAQYNTERSVTFTTGQLEDSVVFSSIPVDQYTYTISAHPDPDLVGEEVVVSLPREPVTLMTTVPFYNANTPGDAVKITSDVLPHTPGDLSSYPTRDDRGSLASRGFVASEVVTVGQGSGFVEVEIRTADEFADTKSVTTGFSLAQEVTVGNVMFGWDVSSTDTTNLGTTWGQLPRSAA